MRADRLTLSAFALIVLIGGVNFLAVRISNQELAPMFGAAVRFAAAALLLLAVAAVGRLALPRGAGLQGSAVYGALSFGLAYALLYVGLARVTAGLASVLMAAVPLLAFLLAVAHGQERFRWSGIGGGMLAVAGIALMSGGAGAGAAPFVYMLAIVGGAVCAAEGSVIAKTLPRSHPVATNAVGMTVGAVLLFALSAAFGEAWTIPQRAQTWWALVYLVLAGSMGMFGLFLFVVRRWTASATAYALPLMPFVAVTLGVWLGGEDVTPALVAGGSLLLAGVYTGALRPSPLLAGSAASGDLGDAREPVDRPDRG
ncbi:MAG: EamA family transporter [Armatimonadota bacterium]|nr:EamA family transporter [Armatimonadota bacterium]MDR5696260.1 EamA family transporter [Armatimonadota bacterium]